MEQLLSKAGWQDAERAEDADLIIINTCSVRITAENRVLGRLSHYSALKKQKHFIVLLIGCMAERLYDDIQKTHPLIDYVVGMFSRHLLPQIFDEIEARLMSRKSGATSDVGEKLPLGSIASTSEVGDNSLSISISTAEPSSASKLPSSETSRLDGREWKGSTGYTFAPFSYHEGAFQSFVPIMNGCNNFCTYCIVPYVRGREVSRSVQDILNEILLLGKKGVKEITLLGQNVNSYRGKKQDGTTIDFPSLLYLIDEVASQQDSIKWIRFISSHPKDMSLSLIDAIANLNRMCKAIHLPCQHGSNDILRRMNRRYTVEHYLEKIGLLRKKMPNVAITSDILIGFPGETEDDVEMTLELMREVKFDNAFMYHYNPREGTPAYTLPARIDEKVKIERLQRIIDLQLEITRGKMLAKLGSEAVLLVESSSRNNKAELFGHTEAGEMAVIEGDELASPELIGNFVRVKLNELKGKTFRCSLIK